MSATPSHAPGSRTHQMLHGPLLGTLLRLATPNIIGLFATTFVIGYDGFILGRIGPGALAGVALVFPLSMLMLQMSAGGIGGGVTAAVARAVGAGRHEDANRLAQHALLVAVLLAALFMVLVLGFGSALYGAMGGRGAALSEALAYSTVLFSGAIVICATNVLAAIVRGAGNMVLPSLSLVGTALIHLVLCPVLAFGWGPAPSLGVAGAAASTLISNALASLMLIAWLVRRDGEVRLNAERWQFRRDLFDAILKVGAPASLSPLISNASIATATALVGTFGTAALAGYGVAARLEYILVPIAFGFGTALTAMVATNMGAGQHRRALHVTWLGAAVVTAITGAIGITAAVAPGLWMNLFTADPDVRAFGGAYLNIVGACYAFFGLGLALFFASQGAGRMLWPLVGSAARLLVIALGGWAAVHWLKLPATAFFAATAASLAIYAAIIAGAIALGGWAPAKTPRPSTRAVSR
ncbi:MAG: MATE family efflux transporter [Burkholderiaceae bacterium]